MSLYDFNREVYVKSVDLVGIVAERNYVVRNGRRTTSYVIDFGQGNDYLTSGDDLRAHDYYCDGCGKSRRGQPHSQHDEAGWFCFLCVGPPAQEKEWRLERELLKEERRTAQQFEMERMNAEGVEA